jgi:cyclopropane fatty-acyl-phospholipid synthase-like methyltransferase
MKATSVAAVVIALCVAPGATAQHQPGAKPDHMEHRFDDPAKYAKSFDDPARDAWQMPDKVIQALAIAEGMSVADIGSGTGYFSVRLAKAAPRATIYGADIEPKMVEYLSKRAAAEHLTNVTAVLAGSANPNLPRPVDLVLVVDTYHHWPSRVDYFRELRKSLTTTGRVAIIDFRKSAPGGPPPEFRFTPQEIEAELTKAGFRLEQSHDFLPRQHFLVFR